MNSKEKEVLRQLRPFLLEEIETKWVSEHLYSNHVISESQRKYFIGEDGTGPYRRASDLLTVLPTHCSWELFCSILSKCGLEHVTKACISKLQELSLEVEIYKRKPKYGKAFLRYTCVAHDLQQRVLNLDERMKHLNPVITFSKSLKGNTRHQYDNLFALSDAGLGMTKTYRTKSVPLEHCDFFQHMKDFMSETSFPELAETVYESRIAEALAFRGELSDALMHSEQSVKCVNLETPCRHNGKLIMTLVNILLQIYSQNKDKKVKKDCLRWVYEGIRQFQNEKQEIKSLWTRMFLATEAYCHLGIDQSAFDIPGIAINENDIELAKAAIQKARTEFGDITDARSEMSFLRAEAKLAVLDTNFYFAQSLLQNALTVSKGMFSLEKYAIEELLKSMPGNIDKMNVTQQSNL